MNIKTLSYLIALSIVPNLSTLLFINYSLILLQHPILSLNPHTHLILVSLGKEKPSEEKFYIPPTAYLPAFLDVWTPCLPSCAHCELSVLWVHPDKFLLVKGFVFYIVPNSVYCQLLSLDRIIFMNLLTENNNSYILTKTEILLIPSILQFGSI
jgi:hypothetical protein